MQKRLIFALILLGFTFMSAQVVLLRELLVIFYGNELSLGITLASWLFWIGFGSWAIGRKIAHKIKEKSITFTLCQAILAFLLPLSIILVRLIPLLFKFSPGEIIGVLAMSIATFVLLAPICILGGFLFVLGCQLYKVTQEGAVQIGYVYILESVGATVGGLLTTLVLIRYFNPVYIMFLLGLVNLLAVSLLLYRRQPWFSFSNLIFLGYIFLVIIAVDSLQNFSLKQQWRTHTLLVSKNSIYGNIAITKRENLYSVFINGLYDFSVPDELISERNAHFPLLEHPQPKEVLLIGGGSSGQLKEVLKHPVKRVDYVELDPLVIDLAKKYLPPNKALNDLRVRLIANMDGRLFIKRTKQKYDVVIINLPEPHTAQLNRFYTQEFFSEVKNILKDNGIFSFCLYSNPNYIGIEQAQLYLTLRNTLGQVFPEVKITPGEANYFLASRQKGLLTLDWRILVERLKQRNIEAKYMREYYLFSELSPERIDFFEDILAQTKVTAKNTDFKPIAYYYNMVLWNTYFKHSLKNLFKVINPKRIYITTVVIYIFLLSPIMFKSLRKKLPQWSILACVGTTGFAEMAFQITTLLSFQVMFGFVYYKLGIILTSFMAGLILGGLWITKTLRKKAPDYKSFIKTQIAIFIYPLILPILFLFFSGIKNRFAFWLGANFVFPFLPIIPGLIGGYQFPLANGLYIKSIKAKVGYSAGLTYGIDLFGSCLGAVLISIFLIPIVGITMSCILVAGLNLIGLILLLRA